MQGLTLPQELLLQVFSHLPLHDLAVAGRICRLWNQVFNDPYLWRFVYNNRFGVDAPEDGVVKDAFRRGVNWASRLQRGDWFVRGVTLGSSSGWRYTCFRCQRGSYASDDDNLPLRPYYWSGPGPLASVICVRDAAGSLLFRGSVIKLLVNDKLLHQLGPLVLTQNRHEILGISVFPSFHSDALMITWQNGIVELYRANKPREPFFTWKGRPLQVPPFVVALPGLRLLVTSREHALHLHRIDANEEISEEPYRLLRGAYGSPSKLVTCVAEGRAYLVAVDERGTVLCWGLEEEGADPLWSFQAFPKNSRSVSAALTVVSEETGDLFLSYTEDGTLALLNPRDGSVERQLQNDHQSVRGVRKVAVVRSVSGVPYAVILKNEDVHIWSLKTGEHLWFMGAGPVDHFTLVRGPDGPYLFVTGSYPLGRLASEPHSDHVIVYMRLFDKDLLQPTYIGEKLKRWMVTYERCGEALARPGLLFAVPSASGLDGLLFSHVYANDRFLPEEGYFEARASVWDFNRDSYRPKLKERKHSRKFRSVGKAASRWLTGKK